MAELGFYPVFPPREDVMVGDVYLADGTRGQRGIRRNLIWFDSVDATSAVDSFYARRPSFPALSPPQPGTGKSKPADGESPGFVAQPQGSAPLFQNGTRANRLRLVQFPGYNVASLTYADLGLAAPVSGVAALLGLSGSNETAVTVSIPQAESYALPAGDALALIGERCRSQDTLYTPQRMSFFAGMFPDMNSRPYLIYITEVFYARAIDYNFMNADAFGANLAATLPGLGALSNDIKALAAQAQKDAEGTAQPSGGSGRPATGNGQAPAGGTPPSPSGSASKDLARKLDELAARTTAMQNGAATLPAPGVRASLGTAGSHGITLRQTFERPVAVGFRGLTLSLGDKPTNAADGCWLAPVLTSPPDSAPMPAPGLDQPPPPPRG